MTVAELIAALQGMPQDATVTFPTDMRPGWFHAAKKVRTVIASDGEFGNYLRKRNGDIPIVVIT